jgi:SNF2 family DNA or RNA helicase
MSSARLKKAGFTSKPQVRAMMQLITSTADCKVNYILDNFNHTKVLVFSQYVEALKAIQCQLIDKGKKVLLYTGDMFMAQRLEVLEQWRTGEYDILLLSVMGARYGLNLIEATDVVLLEPPTSLAILEQVEDRAHRIGQEFKVTSHLLIWGGSDYERLENIINKQEAIEKVYSFLE